MKKSLRMKIMLLLCALVVGYGNVWAEDVTATLTGSAMVIGNNPSTSYTDYTSTGATDSDGNVWYGRWCYQNNNGILQMMQLRTYSNNTDNGNCSRLNVPTFGGTIKTITLSITDGSSTSYNNGTGATTTLYLATAYSKQSVTAILTNSSNSARKTATFDLTTLDDDYTGEGLYILAGGGVRIWSVEVVYTPSSGSDLTDQEFSWSSASFTANIGQSNSYPTLTNTHNLDVTYQSTDESVATINSSGVITLEDEGTTTIKAVFAGNSTYNAKTTTYALTVVDPTLTTIWSEDFSGYSENDVPSGSIPNPHTGTTVHGGVTITYACTNGGGTTKIYENASTGGESPELLVGKSNGTFSATIPLTTASYGFSGDLVLRFKMNANALNVNTTTDGVTVDGEENEGEGVSFSTSGLHKVIFEGVTNATESITVVFTATSSSNVRIDDIVLKGAQAEFTKVATPVILPVSGAVISGTEVTITCSTPDATIYYTMGETPADPTSSSTQYDPANKPTITVGTSIKAIAIKAGLDDSEIASASYTLAEPCATPTFSPAAGEVEKGTTITISTETDDATIYYTTNGTTPTTSSTTYSSAITINSAMTIKAIAAKDGMANSEVASASYTVRDYVVLPFVWAGGTNTSLSAVTGVTTGGCDNYNSNAPYQVKMDGANDYITIKTNSKPSKVAVKVKMIGGGETSKIKVQESADGSSFSDVQELTISGSQNVILTLATSNSFAATTRYVKIIKSVHGSNIGVGPITIDMSSGSQTITDLTITENNTITIGSGCVLTVTGTLTNSGTASNLIIEDGGQLITNSSIPLTYKKQITSAAKDGGWYTISTPVHTASNTFLTPGSVENLILDPATNYDFFYYDEASHTWMNYKQSAFNLNVGQGYLYRNNGAELHFAGYNNQATSYNVALSYASSEDKLLGFNLIGNPYPQNITMSDVTVNNSGTLSGGYVLSKDGAWSADVAATIAPAQGFLVQIDKTGVTATITKPTGGSKSRANNDYIKFIVANSQHEDAAFALFEEGYGLNKIDHRNSDIPMLYIPKEGHNFAIATMDDNTQSFNLNLKAKTTGKYTLTYKATGNYSYLHVIDRLTGEDVDMLMEGEYSFIASPSDAENRFIVRLEYSNGYENSEDSIFAYQSGSDIIVNGEGELQIFDVMGRRVATQYVSGVETINLQSHGVYIFKLNEKTQKIVVR